MVLFFVSSMAAFLVRTAGITLFAAAAFYFILHNQWKKVGLTITLLVSVILIQISLIVHNPGFLTAIAGNPKEFMASQLANITQSFLCISYFFCPSYGEVSSKILDCMNMMIKFLTWPALIAIFLGVFYRIKNKALTFLEIFFVFYLILLIFWSGFGHQPLTFTRYSLPIIGPLLILACLTFSKFFKNIGARFFRAILGILIVVNIFNIIIFYDFNDDVLLQKDNQEMFGWVKSHLTENEHFMIWPSRAVTLMTQRVGTAFVFQNKKNENNILKRIDDYNISYLIAYKQSDIGIMQLCESRPDLFKSIWENESFRIFKVVR